MAYLQRLIVAAFVLLFASTSYASFPATQTNTGACTVAPCTEYRANNPWGSFGNGTTFYSSPSAACQAVIATIGSRNAPWVYSFVSATTTQCNGSATNGSSTGYASSAILSQSLSPVAPVYSCPSNSTLSGSTCTCQSGFSESAGTCVDPNVNKCLAASGGSDLYTGFSSITMGSSFCPSDGLSSCASTVTGGFATIKNGVKTWTYEVTYSGSTCTPPTSGTVGSETECKGTVGTVNGVTVCSPPSDRNTVESIKGTTATNPVSAASAPGSGGSTTTQEATQCTGSKCSTTTTTTTTPAGGGAPTVTVKTEDVPKDDYCRDNPRAIMCLTSSFGGACSGGFVCEGDAVQCATAREIHTRNCRMFDQESPESLLYGTEKNKSGSQVSNENVAISSSNFDTSDAIGGSAACITDKVVTVMGSPITIPFSGVCVHLAMLGNVLLTVSFLLAGRIFMRG